jgi:hypothetical protein
VLPAEFPDANLMNKVAILVVQVGADATAECQSTLTYGVTEIDEKKNPGLLAG